MSSYWKNKYKDQWAESNKREKSIASEITALTGYEVEFSGFGAGSNKFIHGTASQNNHKKGDSDLSIKGTNIFVEVTGPLTGNFRVDADLWIRPDKIEYARSQLKSQKSQWLVHCLGHTNMRVIHFDENFFKDYDNNNFKKITPMIRGSKEGFIAIPANSKYITPFITLIDFLNRYKKVV